MTSDKSIPKAVSQAGLSQARAISQFMHGHLLKPFAGGCLDPKRHPRAHHGMGPLASGANAGSALRGCP